MADSLGRELAEALGTKDAERLKTLLAPDIDFRAMTPSIVWESRDPEEIVDTIMLGQWFDVGADITAIESVDVTPVARRERAVYRYRVTNPGGRFLVEQTAYVDGDGSQITWLRIMCAGYQRVD